MSPENARSRPTAGTAGTGSLQDVAGSERTNIVGLLYDNPPPPRLPNVYGAISVDVSPCVDGHGWVDQAEAVRTIWSAACDLPPGCALEVRLGHAKYVDQRVAALLAEVSIGAASVLLVGADPNVTRRWVTALRKELRRWAW